MIPIRLKRSDVTGKVPLPSDLELGELALNVADGKAYMKLLGGGIKDLNDVSSDTDLSEVPYEYAPGVGEFRTLAEKLRDRVSVKDFGAKGDGVTNDVPAFLSAITYVQQRGGGTVHVPAGTYKMSGELSIGRISPSDWWAKVILEGDGWDSTVLDFSTAPPDSDGIAIIGWTGRLGISDLSVVNAPRVGINVNKGVERGDQPWVSRIYMKDVVVERSGDDGIRFTQVYMGKFDNIESRNNEGHGFNLRGFHTSMFFTRCWAGGDEPYPNGGNKKSGWAINGITYSQFIACGSDNNEDTGYTIENTAGVVFSGCGSEVNFKEGFLVLSRNETISGMPPDILGVQGLSFDGCFSINNAVSDRSLYANFLGVMTENGRPASISVSNCVDITSSLSAVSNAYMSVNGAIEVSVLQNRFMSPDVSSGDVFIQNIGVIGKSTLLRLIQGQPQAIPTSTSTVVAFPTAVFNTMRATVSNGRVVIPKGVGRVKVTAGVIWDGNVNGFRSARIFVNNPATEVVGAAQGKIDATADGVSDYQNISTAILEVQEGDTIGLEVIQNTGDNLNLRADPLTYLSVEAMG